MSAGPTPTPTPLPASAGLQIKRLSERATLPTRGSALAAGYDLYAAEPKLIPARSKALIDTQLSLAVPLGTYGRIAPRSGLASKFGIQTGAGVVDCDYRGVLFVLLFNHGGEDFQVNAGDRIAQLILEKIETPEIIEVQQLDATVRGEGGFGSTGGFGGLPGTAGVVTDKAGEVAGLVGQGMDVVGKKTAELVESVKEKAPGVVEQVVEGVRGVGEALGGAGGAQAQPTQGQGQAK